MDWPSFALGAVTAYAVLITGTVVAAAFLKARQPTERSTDLPAKKPANADDVRR